ncbi:MAG: hypothetical protein KAH01_05715, partial [Caldisericia bacterium]|nr:hypothetical protein [Caldisericia bacterium]
ENTGNPPRMSGPHSAQMVPTTGNPCFLPDVGTGGQVGDIPLNDNNNTCLANFNVFSDDGETFYKLVKLPNDQYVKVYLGTVNIGDDGSFTVGRWYTMSEVKVVGTIGPITKETDDFIEGIEEAIKFMSNKRNGLMSAKALWEGLTYMNQYLTKEMWNNFSTITANYSESEQRKQFMKHAVIGGYVASKMKNFSDATGTTYADEGMVNFEIGFWVSFYAERATNWYNTKFNTNYIIPLFSTDDEVGLITISNLVKVLCNAEHGGNNGNPTSFLADDTMNVKYSGGFVTGAPGSWIAQGAYGNKKLNYSGLYTTYKEWNSKKECWETLISPNNRFINISIGVGVLFNKLQDKKATGARPAFSGKSSLLEWLKATRLYNGRLTEKHSETYNHCLHISNLFRILYGSSLSDAWRKDLDEFDKYIKSGAE